MAELHVNPTRMELKKLQVRYQTARRGHKLLKDMRDELMRRFLAVVRDARALRERVEAALSAVYAGLLVAGATSDPRMLDEALLLPAANSEVAVKTQNRMSVTVPTFESEALRADAEMIYGLAFTSGELDASLSALSAMREDLLRLAALEKETQLLAAEIERTRRRVNALEHIMMPRYAEAIRRIRMKLDENERGNITRLLKVKDMMLASKYGKHDDFFPDEE